MAASKPKSTVKAALRAEEGAGRVRAVVASAGWAGPRRWKLGKEEGTHSASEQILPARESGNVGALVSKARVMQFPRMTSRAQSWKSCVQTMRMATLRMKFRRLNM